MKAAVSFAWRMVWRVRRAMYSADTTATTASTSSEIARVNLVFRLRRIIPPRLVFFELVVKSLEANTKQFRGPRFVLAGGGQGLQNQFAFSSIHSGSNGKAKPPQSGSADGRSMAEVRRKMMAGNRAPVRGDHRPLQHVAQLADIARPRIGTKKVHGIRADAGDSLAVLCGYFGKQVIDQDLQVFLVLTQRR